MSPSAKTRRRSRDQSRRGGRKSSPPPRQAAAVAVAEELAPRRRRWLALALFAGLFALYLANGRTLALQSGGDTIPNRLIPFSLLRFGTVTLEPFRAAFAARG